MGELSTEQSNMKHIARNSLIITIVLVGSKIMGYFRELIGASIFGATRESDILKISTTIPVIFYSCVAAALVTTFIPVFSNVKDNKEEANKFFNNIYNIIILGSIVLVILGIIGAPLLVKLVAGGFKGDDYTLAVSMTKIVMPSLLFLTLTGLLTGYLQSYSMFLQPALTGICADIVIILGIIIFSRYGIVSAVIATLLGSVAQFLIQRPFLKGFKYKFYINFKDENIKKMLILSIPILISTAVGQINTIVDRNFASNLNPGSISVVDYASKLSSIINQVFIVSITTVLYPMLTDKYNKNKIEDFKEFISRSIVIVIMICTPFVLGLVVLSNPMVKLLLQHGKFDKNATEITSLCLKYLAFSAIGYSLFDIIGKVFFSIKDTITPMINNFMIIGINILLLIILVPKYEVIGLALATTLSAIIMAVIMYIQINFKLKGINNKKIFISSIKIIIASIIMSVLVGFLYKVINNLFQYETFIVLIIEVLFPTIAGIIVYALLLYLLRIDELKYIISLKIKKNKGE